MTGDGVRVWRFALGQPVDALGRLERSLSPDERARADRFKAGPLRASFVAGRGGLRAVLAAELSCDPSDLAFIYGPHGKPELAEPWASTGLRFNLAHSGGLALCALAYGRAVGVDVEAGKDLTDFPGIIRRFFSSAEQSAFLALPEADRRPAFFRAWARKEAFLKAVGTGLATALDSFDVTLGPAEPAALLRVGDDPDEAGRWTLLDLDAGPGYASALAVAGKLDADSVRQFDGLPPSDHS